jgi:head-tail adaptor
MRTPRLNRRLSLEQPIRTPDGAGGFATAWEGLGTLWAEVDPGTTRFAAQAGGTGTRLPVKVTVRAAPYGAPSRPEPGQRFRDGDRTYGIVSVMLGEHGGRFLECYTREEGAL